MRQKRDPQRNFLHLMTRTKIARELEVISQVLDRNPGILDLVFRDLVKYQRTDTGRDGLTAEQVLRCALLKQYRELTCEELAFHLEDSMAFRSFARLPAKTGADGGFASRDNLRLAQGRGVKDVRFAKKRGLRVLEMVRSLWVYKKLRNFRAGLEANISRLKRAFGLERCNWRGRPGFRQYVWSAIVSYNVLVLGMLLQAP